MLSSRYPTRRVRLAARPSTAPRGCGAVPDGARPSKRAARPASCSIASADGGRLHGERPHLLRRRHSSGRSASTSCRPLRSVRTRGCFRCPPALVHSQYPSQMRSSRLHAHRRIGRIGSWLPEDAGRVDRGCPASRRTTSCTRSMVHNLVPDWGRRSAAASAARAAPENAKRA